jgi:hypothetical protein
MFIGNFQGT